MTIKAFNRYPVITSTLDPTYTPIEINFRAYECALKHKLPIVIGIERQDHQIASYKTYISADDEDHGINLQYIEYLIKSLLWIKGGFRILIDGPTYIIDHISKIYQPNQQRAFDAQFMASVYEHPIEVIQSTKAEILAHHEITKPLGRHLDGCRIGFDAGGSDRKVSAVIDGKTIYSEEVIWHPKEQSDPNYHYEGILSSMKTAASKLPKVDAIGVSSAGIYINNRIMAASLFIKVDQDAFDRHVKNMYLDIAKALGDVPIEVANDGDVTALAGAMSLNQNKILGIAMGTSQAAGYVDGEGNITGWLNELAFVPVDLQTNAPIDEWSQDIGCGVKYYSQDAVIRLAEKAGVDIPKHLTLAEKLAYIQDRHNQNDEKVDLVFDTMGIYLAHGLAYYARFYDFDHVLILGRVTSGKGGLRMLEMTNRVLEVEFKDLYDKIKIHLPDENNRRVGQSIAAASLPDISNKGVSK